MADITDEHGFYESHKLFEELLNDAQRSFAELNNNRESQYHRRNAVRAAFGYIEAVCAVLSNEVKLKFTERQIALTEKERKVIAGQETELLQRLKKSFSCYAKLHEAKFTLDTSSDGFQQFIAAKTVRNALTHPKRYKQIVIEEHHIFCIASSYIWVKDEFKRLMESVMQSCLLQLPENDRKIIVEMISERDKG